MKATDIINRLKEVIPRYTGLFSTELNVTSLSFNSGIVTCECAGHGLKVGDEVHISGALTPISIISLERVNTVVTATTASNHDLTLGYQKVITLAGADQVEYNGTHNLIGVPNRKSFKFVVDGAPVTPATGNIKMVEDIKAGYNGLHNVLNVIDANHFTFAITSEPESPALGVIKLRKEARITGSVTMDRFLYSYSKKALNEFFLVVILGGTNASKDRKTVSDATNTSTAGAVSKRITIVDPFSIFVVAPTSEYLDAMTVRDGMENIFNVINKSILFHTFPTGSSSETNLSCSFIGHDIYAYEVAYYVHEFKYQFVYDLWREDGIDDDDSVAFRDIDLHFNSYLNARRNEIMHTLVDLDEQPLP